MKPATDLQTRVSARPTVPDSFAAPAWGEVRRSSVRFARGAFAAIGATSLSAFVLGCAGGNPVDSSRAAGGSSAGTPSAGLTSRAGSGSSGSSASIPTSGGTGSAVDAGGADMATPSAGPVVLGDETGPVDPGDGGSGPAPLDANVSSAAADGSGDKPVGIDGSSSTAPGADASLLYPSDASAAFVSLFDGASLTGWIQVPAGSWSVVNGAMHSLGTARGYIYTAKTYGDFRLVFHSRLVADPANHNPCVLFWGTAPAPADALGAIQVQPPQGYMWDYRATGPTANKSPDMYEKRFGHPALVSKEWSQCEMLANRAQGTVRFACCQWTGAAPCKASEIVDFHDPTAGRDAPLALQVHNGAMIEEFADIVVESPVADPNNLVTTQ